MEKSNTESNSNATSHAVPLAAGDASHNVSNVSNESGDLDSDTSRNMSASSTESSTATAQIKSEPTEVNDKKDEASKKRPLTEAGDGDNEGSPSGKKATLERTKSAEESEDGHHKSKREKQEEERLNMQVLVSNFSESQLNRYEMYRRAAFPKASIKRLMQSITGSIVAPNVVIAMSGITKVFVGEVVETALDVKQRWGDTGPLQPKHLREAVRLMKHTQTMPNTKYQKKLFR